MGWDVLCDLADVLAAADGSQAWLQHIYADHTVLVATFPAQAQDEVWGKNHSTITSASFDPIGRATRVDGGFLYSGRHGFSSGIDYAELADLRRLDRGEGRPRRPALLPGAEERRRGARRLGHHGARRHRLEELRRHRQVHPVAPVSRRPPVAFRNRPGNRGQQGGGLSRAALRRHGGGRIFGARRRHGARRVRGVARPYRTANVARRRRRRAAGHADPRRSLARPRSTPRTRSISRRCAAACASSRRAAPRAAPSA